MTAETPLLEPTHEQPSGTPDGTVSLGRVAIGLLHIAALSAVAVAQPMFDLLGKNAEFFVARDSEPIDIWLLTIALVLAVPLMVAAIELVARLIAPIAYTIAHLVFVGGLTSAIALQVLTRVLAVNGAILVVVAVLIGAGVGYAYHRFETLRSFLTWLSIAPVIVVASFLFFTPVSRLLFPSAVAFEAGGVGAADTPVILIVWDEFNSVGIVGPDGEIDGDLYPNFARVAADGTFYRRASGVSDASSLAIPAILDGMVPDPDLLPIAVDHPRSLFTLLSESHQISAREPTTAVCAPGICQDPTPPAARPGLAQRLKSLVSDLRIVYLYVLLPDDLTEALPPIDRAWGGFGENAASLEGEIAVVAQEGSRADALRESFADRRANDFVRDELASDRVASVEQFVAGLPEPDGRPPFVFMDAALPHAPYRYAPSGRQYRDSGQVFGLESGRWADDDWLATQGEQRYLMQIQVVDALLGDMVAWLEDRGLYEEALVIVTADHGVAFTPDEYLRNATPGNFGETMSVPMIVKLPQQATGTISDADVRTTDVYPTVLDVLGIDVTWEVDGRSLLLDPIDRGPKIQMRTDGTIVEGDPSMPAWDLALENKIRRFGTDSGSIDVYRPARTSPIVGREITTLTVVDGPSGRAQVESLDTLVSFDPALGISPSHITGRIWFDEPVDGNFAVVLNGVVELVGPVVEADSLGGRFSYFLPEDAVLPGANTLALYLVQGTGEDPELVPIDIEESRLYSTSVYADGNEYLESDGVGIPIGTRLSGSLDAVVRRGSVYSFAGWAADTTLGQPADEIVLIVDGVSVLVSPPNLRRPDVGDALGDPAYAASGFALEIAIEVIDRAESVRVFGVTTGEAATEFPLPDGAFGQ
jgi:hypothetical protein